MPPGRRNAVNPGPKTPPIQSLQRGLGILEFVARKGSGVSMAEVSRQVGLHTSTTFHLLRTLSTLGFLQQDETTKQYFPGSKIFHLATSASTELQLLNCASPVLAELARQTGEASHLAVLERQEIIVIAKVDGNSRVGLSDRVGYPRPAHCTAIGKVLLASLADADLEAFLRTAQLAAFTAKSITSAAQLRQELDRVRTQDYAFDDEEFVQGIRCLASGVRNFSGRVVGAVGISGPVWRVSLDRVAPLTGLVMDAARGLSQSLGHTGTATDGGNGAPA
jgi:IclR family acetate operon transcriptional repressor